MLMRRKYAPAVLKMGVGGIEMGDPGLTCEVLVCCKVSRNEEWILVFCLCCKSERGDEPSRAEMGVLEE